MQVFREVKLADGAKYKVKKVNILGNIVPDHLRDSFMFLKRHIEGSDAMLLNRKINSINRSVDRLERLAVRAEAFIDAETTSPEKREEYFHKFEVFLSEKDKVLAALDEEETKYTKLIQTLTERAIEVAIWGMTLDPNCMSIESAESIIDESNAVSVVRALLGMYVEPVENEDLRPTETSAIG